MINNINYTIKIDLTAFYDELVLTNCIIFGVTPIFNDDETYTIKEWGVTGKILEIMHTFIMKDEEKLRKAFKNGDLDYVEERLGIKNEQNTRKRI